MKLGASTIVAIYKDRWQIELYFKALKQNLKIKTFVGISPNAVKDPDLDGIDRDAVVALSATVLLLWLEPVQSGGAAAHELLHPSRSVVLARLTLFHAPTPKIRRRHLWPSCDLGQQCARMLSSRCTTFRF